jgi:hypothetical protein
MWCHVGAAQKEHGSHCKEEQGDRAPIVVPQRSHTEGTYIDRIVKRNREAGPMWCHIGAAQKEHGLHCKGDRRGSAPMWCHIGAAQKEHGSHCKGEQGGRAQLWNHTRSIHTPTPLTGMACWAFRFTLHAWALEPTTGLDQPWLEM